MASGQGPRVTGAILSIPGYYNDIYGPFKLPLDRLSTATSLTDFGWQRHFDVDFDSLEDRGWYQFLRTKDGFTGASADSAPREFYLVGAVGGVRVAVESKSAATGPRRVAGQLQLVPPKLRSVLEQTAAGATIPTFFLQERSPANHWVLELGLASVLMIALLWSFVRSVVNFRMIHQRPRSGVTDQATVFRIDARHGSQPFNRRTERTAEDDRS